MVLLDKLLRNQLVLKVGLLAFELEGTDRISLAYHLNPTFLTLKLKPLNPKP